MSNPLKPNWDVIVVGGGPAGFFAAIRCAELDPKLNVLIIEKASQTLGKVIISGGGRCNVTHACFAPRGLTENYPRLGYMTFMDAIMAIIFIVNALVVIYNVYMRRLEMADRAKQAERIDDIMDWLYPILYIVAFGVVYYLFFVATPPA